MSNKAKAGWVALVVAIILAIEASIARWFPSHSAAGSEATIISAMLAFAAAAFGVSAYESKHK